MSPIWTPSWIGHGGAFQTNLTAAARTGTTVTADGVAHVKGAWSSLIDPTTYPTYGVWVELDTVAVSNTLTSMLVDIGYGPTGGLNEQVIIPNLLAGAAREGLGDQGRLYFIPCYIPAGVRVSARCQAVVVSDTVAIKIYLEQQPRYPGPFGGCLAYGVVSASSRGTVATSGTNAFGAWVSLGLTSRHHRFWAIGVDQGTDSTNATGDILVEIGVGPDASNVTPIMRGYFSVNSSERIDSVWPSVGAADVPSGLELWARIAGAGTGDNYGVAAYGID
jgi:hypothetical protein